MRAETAEAGRQRVLKNLTAHNLGAEALADRIEAVVGDLALPFFGLAEADFKALAERVDTIYHNGAIVHWVYPYSKLKPANVNSTVEALRLATCGSKLLSMHFVSSTSVFDR